MSLAEFRWLDLSTWQPRSPGRRASGEDEGLSAADRPVDRTVGTVLIKLTGLGRPSPLWQPHSGGPDCEKALSTHVGKQVLVHFSALDCGCAVSSCFTPLSRSLPHIESGFPLHDSKQLGEERGYI